MNVFCKNCLSPEQQDMKGIFFCDCSETPIPIIIGKCQFNKCVFTKCNFVI